MPEMPGKPLSLLARGKKHPCKCSVATPESKNNADMTTLAFSTLSMDLSSRSDASTLFVPSIARQPIPSLILPGTGLNSTPLGGKKAETCFHRGKCLFVHRSPRWESARAGILVHEARLIMKCIDFDLLVYCSAFYSDFWPSSFLFCLVPLFPLPVRLPHCWFYKYVGFCSSWNRRSNKHVPNKYSTFEGWRL